MKVLVAEPSRIGRTIVTRMLVDDGYEVICCDTAEAALECLGADETFDVLITAVEFATMSGLELCWQTRILTDKDRPIYIVVLSSSQDELKLVEALDCGADDFINKPPRKSELLARLRAASRLLQAQRELVYLASYDSLTGLRNRRSFFEDLGRFEALDAAASIMMLDIDYFKQVNDRHGHDAGDDVLREMGQRLVAFDKGFARLGGEEFGLMIKGPITAAGEMAEAIRRKIAATPFQTCSGPLPVTASIGVAERLGRDKFEHVLKDADIALYASKSAGRNCVTLSRSGGEGPQQRGLEKLSA